VLLELGKFVSLLLSILCLYAVFHTAFLTRVDEFHEHILPVLRMFVLAAAACWSSGWIFHRWEQKAGAEHSRIAGTFPVKIFWWASAGFLILFALSWFIEDFYLPLRTSLSR
jgi:hypothetical protein